MLLYEGCHKNNATGFLLNIYDQKNLITSISICNFSMPKPFSGISGIWNIESKKITFKMKNVNEEDNIYEKVCHKDVKNTIF